MAIPLPSGVLIPVFSQWTVDQNITNPCACWYIRTHQFHERNAEMKQFKTSVLTKILTSVDILEPGKHSH